MDLKFEPSNNESNRAISSREVEPNFNQNKVDVIQLADDLFGKEGFSSRDNNKS